METQPGAPQGTPDIFTTAVDDRLDSKERQSSGQSSKAKVAFAETHGHSEFSSQAFKWSSEHRRSFPVDSSNELLNNEVTQALRRVHRPSITSVSMLETLQDLGGPVDWNRHKNVDRLSTTRKIIRNLFWALQNELDSEKEVSMHVIRTESRIRQQASPLITKIVRHDYFAVFFLVLTLYALFGPDLCACFGHTALNRDDLSLAVVNTIVLVAFILEELLNCFVFQGYLCSLRFWIDTLATFSIAGDSLLGTEFLQSDAFVAMRGSRLTKVLRVGGRSSKFVRFLRAARHLQLVRLVPRVYEFMNRSINELSLQLWLKRVRHVFNYLDGGTGILGEHELIFFNTAMQVEFGPTQETGSWIERSVDRMVRWVRSERDLPEVIPWNGPMSMTYLAKEFMGTASGRRSFQRCKEDIQSMKESCAIVEQASDRLTLKVCILVLMLLLTMQLLMGSGDDTSRIQGLVQIDALSLDAATSPADLCAFISKEFTRVARDATFLMLVANYRVFWEPGCQCCQPDVVAAGPPLPVSDTAAELAGVEDLVQATGLEDHEILIEVVMDSSNMVRALAVFDNHVMERSLAVNSLLQTILVVVLLTTLVLYFSTDMRKMASQNVLHPLWNLMDDMCSLKNIDVLVSGQQGAVPDDLRRALQRRCGGLGQRLASTLCQCKRPVATADELLQLRTAFDKLHLAMQSWSKYVPLILLKQLFEARVEASIGCSFEEVCVVFTAVSNFDDVCEDLSAKQVLDLMSGVLGAVYEALDNNSGTMLEFIGDEVLAVFNAPTKVPNFEFSALSAAVEAQELVDKLGHTNVLLNTSVHRARVLAGNLGSPTRMKYGVLGDGVNLAARLKSLNTRYKTHILVSSEALDFPGSEDFLVRPIGDLILKGRTTPTRTFEVLAKAESATTVQRTGAEKHSEAFDLYRRRQFADAKRLFEEVHELMRQTDTKSSGDQVAEHFVTLCEQYMETPPPDGWDGSEKLQKKSF